jgi:hypothetical protein
MRATGSSVEVRRNRITNPSFRATDSTSTEVRRNYVTDPNCTAITSYNNPMGTGSTVTLDTTTFFSGTSSLKITAGSTAPDATYGWGTFLTPIAVSIGIGVQFQWRVRLRSAVNLTVNVAPTANSGLLSGVGVMPISLLANTWTEVVVDFTTTVALTNVYMIIGTPTASAVFNVDTVFVGNAGYENFDGSTPASGPYTYSWVGTANASQSVQSATLPEMRRNTYQNPSWRNTSGTVEVRRNYITDPRLVTASGWANVTASGAAGGATFTALAQTYSPNQTAVPGEVWTGSIDLTNAGTVTWTGNITVKGTTGGAFGVNTGVSVPFSVPVGATQRVLATLTIGAGADGVRMMLDTMNTVTGMRLDKALLERHSTLGTYFDGTTVNTGGLVYTWTGTANASASIASGPAPVTAPFLGYGGQLGVVGWVSAPGVYSVMAKMSIGAGGILAFGNSDVVQGGTNQRWASRFKARLATGVGPISFDARLLAYNAAGATLAVNVALNNTTAVVPADGSWADIEVPTATISPTQTVSIRPIIYYQGSSIPAGTVIEFKEALLARQMDGVVGRAPMAYIDGSTPAGDGVTYAWGGTANASTSYATVSRLAGWSVGRLERRWGHSASGHLLLQRGDRRGRAVLGRPDHRMGSLRHDHGSARDPRREHLRRRPRVRHAHNDAH